jgi:hypothetical protein
MELKLNFKVNIQKHLAKNLGDFYLHADENTRREIEDMKAA